MPEIRDLLDDRLKMLLGGIFLSLLILLGGLYFFQIFHGDKYVRLAYNNRLRLIRFSAPRGEIFDRHGVPLAVNETTFSIMGYPLDLNTTEKLERLSGILTRHGIPMTVEALERTIHQQRWAPYRVIRLVPNLTMPQMAALVADPEFPRELFPLSVWRRTYPAGALAANILGYVGEISEEELKASSGGEYSGGDLIGKSGIERSYEAELRGLAGEEALEVDARGRRVRTLDSRVAIKGEDLRLTLDMGVQKLAVELLAGHKGALVAMDVKTGAILALASSPTYDNNPLAWGVSGREWRDITRDPAKPMLDRSIAGVYPPASTFKALVALAALEENVATTSTSFFCGGALRLPSRTFRCWRRSGHGTVNVLSALQHSCDVYFYQVGLKLGIDRLLKWCREFRLGEPTGIDLPGESSGTIAGPEWKKRRFKENWYQGDTINYSIGQGYLLLTPLQVARIYAAVANGGKLVSPFLCDRAYREPVDMGIGRESLSIVQKGLDYVVRKGTGARAGKFGVTVAGKTGTAQNAHGDDHALFAGYAPADDPKYVAVVVIEAGKHGSSVASPIVGELLAHILSHPAGEGENQGD
ncbi:penicillin-binding protein 2 [Fretibacterium sp. OH1220_COT-178]|uniref:penicillin-binding protein 2 n=1 Tax=Fretibacterium sp. OH1220_COT-178 TaxID=2491047 RepID=UPI000F6013F1|nr:penicillin-binding protein 2 [Fretibacterium sp. OH1220_COT-178]RRD65891.1 penicillin-binding protein 2 [Fretibacterium sp. OH1220_COT-178]